MGYSTYFTGSFSLSRPLTLAEHNYLTAFNQTRRMKRDVKMLHGIPDDKREAVKLPLGPDGAYFVGYEAANGQNHSPDILEYNNPPVGQPSLWCGWVPSEDGMSIEHDGGEKFYGYIEWIEYIVEHFLTPWGITVNGTVEWHGEDPKDLGRIIVNGSQVTAKKAKIVYE